MRTRLRVTALSVALLALLFALLGASLPSLPSVSVSSTMTDPSGVAMPATNLAGWRLVFSDNFAKNIPLGQWPAATGGMFHSYSGPDTTRHGLYNDARVMSQHGGVLDYYIHTERGVHLVAAPVPNLRGVRGNSSRGMRIAVRFRADYLPGYKTAWLLWPDSEAWPRDGEIDFPEGGLNSTIEGFVHHQGAASGNDQDGYETHARYVSGWHTAVIEWNPARGYCDFYLDGVRIGHSTSRIPNTPMQYDMQTETGTTGGAPANNVAGHVQVDWISIWVPA